MTPPDPHSATARNQLWARLTTAVDDAAAHRGPLPTPLMVVDLDAFDANAADLRRRAAGTTIRVASKSLRVPALVSRALALDGLGGVLGYTLAEALWLHEHDVCHDVVVAYPTVDAAALRQLLASPAVDGVTLMADDPAHLDVVDAQRTAPTRDVEVRVAIDVAAGLRMGGQHVGPQRSPLHEPPTWSPWPARSPTGRGSAWWGR